MKIPVMFRAVPLTVALVLAAGCASTQPVGGAQEVAAVGVSMSGTITAIDSPSRLLTVRDEGGAELQVHADDSVRNFEQLRIGDTVTLEYVRSVALDILPAGSAKPGAYIKDDTQVSKLGEKPGIAKREVVTVLAPILAIDTAGNTVTVKGPRGNVVTLDVQKPENQALLGQLKQGDMLHVTFTDAAAISVSPKGR